MSGCSSAMHGESDGHREWGSPLATHLECGILGLRAGDEVHAVGLRQVQLLLHPRLQAVVLGPLTAVKAVRTAMGRL